MAGVSTAAASRILNGDTSYQAREATRERVFAAAEQLGYRPNLFARNLRLGSANRLALLYDRPFNPWASVLATRLEKAAVARGVEFFVRTVHHQDALDEAEKLFESGQCDGAVFAFTHIASRERWDALKEIGMPIALHDCEPPVKEGGVWVDYGWATEKLLAHMIKLGHRRITFIGGRYDNPPGEEHNVRLNTYLRFMAEHGLPTRVIDIGFEPNGAMFQRLEQAVEEDPKGAYLCFQDEWAHYLFHIAHKLGLAIPGDVAVAAFDDLPVSRYLPSPLTTVAYPYDRVSELLLDLYLERGHKEGERPVYRIEPEVVIRESCGEGAQHS